MNRVFSARVRARVARGDQRRSMFPEVIVALAMSWVALAASPARAVLVHFVANPINSANECPPCTSANGTGCGAFTLDTVTGRVRYYIVHNQGGETAAHVHGPAGLCPATAGVLFGLPVGPVKTGSYGPLTAVQQANMNGSLHYANIHTGTCATGAIRGQIVPLASGVARACCLQGGAICMDTDPSTCLCLGGTPLPTGSACGGTPQACCLPNNDCLMLDPVCCAAQGGTVQPVGAACSGLQACCLPDGTCVDIDPLCCDDIGGTPQGAGTNCLTFDCPAPQCGPLPDLSACIPVTCPNPNDVCVPRCVKYNPQTGEKKVLACECRNPNECHVAIDTPTGAPHCAGACPPGFDCETTTVTNPDGTVDICCDCVPRPYQNWVVADDFCGPTCPTCECDFDGDGQCTTFGDFQMLQSCFGPVTPACRFADLNCDGVVDNIDATIWACLAGGNPPDVCCPDVTPPPVHISEVRWFGSYLDPDFDPKVTPNPRPVDGWVVGLHRDQPPQPCPTGANFDACGVVSPPGPGPLGCVTFTPDGSATPIPLTPPGGAGCAAGCVIPPPGYWRICARYTPDCITPCSPVPGALCVLQFLPCETGISRPDRLIAQWIFHPQIVPPVNVGKTGCDQHAIFGYQGKLADACLVENCAGPDEIDPLMPGIFRPRPGVTYWLSVQAVVGHRVTPPPDCAGIKVPNTVTREYWGWHTTPPGYHHKDDAYIGRVELSCRIEWLYRWLYHLHWSQPRFIQCADDPTKSIDMAFCLFDTAGNAYWCQPLNPGPPPPSDPPRPPRTPTPPGIDELTNTVAQAVVEFFPPGPGIVSMQAAGLTRVWRDHALALGTQVQIPIEIISMHLTGLSPVGPVTIREQVMPHSNGLLFGPGSDPFLPTPIWPMDSFFDVFARIELPGAPPGFQNLFTQAPVHLDAVGGIWEVPPSFADYQGPPGGDGVLLFDESNPTQPVGRILFVSHRVVYRGGVDIHSDMDWSLGPWVCSCDGDVNGDGQLNGLDVDLFTKCLLNQPQPPLPALGCPCDCADMTGENVVDLADIGPFIDILLAVPKAVCPLRCP